MASLNPSIGIDHCAIPMGHTCNSVYIVLRSTRIAHPSNSIWLTICEFTYVSVAIRMSDPSKPVWLAVSEFTYVSVATFIIPNSLTVGLPIFEFPNIFRTIWMCSHSGSVWLAIDKRSNIYRTVRKSIGTPSLRYALLGFTNITHKLIRVVWRFLGICGSFGGTALSARKHFGRLCWDTAGFVWRHDFDHVVMKYSFFVCFCWPNWHSY